MATHEAMVTTGIGTYDVLQYRSVPTPPLPPTSVRIKVLSAGVNNTDINTRIGWYDKEVTEDTNSTSTSDSSSKRNGYGDAPTPFPLIQGTDCAGRILEVGSDLQAQSSSLLNMRCLVASCQANVGWFGSDFDGGFQTLVTCDVKFVHPLPPACPLSDAQLGSIPCAYGTAENMLIKVGVKAGDVVLVPGASGGVGSAVVELCGVAREGITVLAIVGPGKRAEFLSRFAGDHNIEVFEGRHGSAAWGEVMEKLKKRPSVVVDNVGGGGTMDLLGCLQQGGRYVTSGAIAGPVIPLDLRTLYLNDLTMVGSTTWVPGVMENLVRYIADGNLNPHVHKTYPLREMGKAQEEFLKKKHVGKIVLVTES
ncbi:hypothetical protein TeGR_g8347 [Tetraparma gracilis]|uniref:Enoyl reductase (ER) domain-containing protein n=1 Tax=Tetraparma gracilis TaxID=2962635 RepID=A0ABQ6MBP6_9STRA|nr:hypothetical protein TeGR_g8347 [Tetraparma gracilis]